MNVQSVHRFISSLLLLCWQQLMSTHATLPQEGAVIEWGGTYPFPGGLRAVRIAAGAAQDLALKEDGTVVAWVEGNTVADEAVVPVGLSGVVAVAAGYGHSLALRQDGKVIGWGDINIIGKMPAGLSGVSQISTRDSHDLALKQDRTVVAWGDNYWGQLDVPSGLNDVIAVAAGSFHSLALKADGTVIAWGAGRGLNGYGLTNVPTGLKDVTAIAAGAFHSLALKSDGTVVAWGAGAAGTTGDQDKGQSNVPAGLTGVVAISAGHHHSLALKKDGTIVQWGFDKGAVIVPTLTGVVAISAGADNSLAIKTDILPTPHRATARARVAGGIVTGIEIVDAGYGYIATPSVQFSGGGGSGASALVTLSKSYVTDILLTSGGHGYSTIPAVIIDSPPFASELRAEVSRIAVKMKVMAGFKYLLESSYDLKTWTPNGDPFVAQEENVTQEFLVQETGRFFRITRVP